MAIMGQGRIASRGHIASRGRGARAYVTSLNARTGNVFDGLGWAWLGCLITMPVSSAIRHALDLGTTAGLLVALVSGSVGYYLGTRVLRPVYHARRGRSKRFQFQHTEEAESLRSNAEAFFLSQGQDPLRAGISAAELMDSARTLTRGGRVD